MGTPFSAYGVPVRPEPRAHLTVVFSLCTISGMSILLRSLPYRPPGAVFAMYVPRVLCWASKHFQLEVGSIRVTDDCGGVGYGDSLDDTGSRIPASQV